MSKNKKASRGEMVGEYFVVCGEMVKCVDANDERHAIVLSIDMCHPMRWGPIVSVQKGSNFPKYFIAIDVMRSLGLVEEFCKDDAPIEPETKTRKRHKFTKPTVEEISAYCKEHKYDVDPQYFFDKNESQGWVTGKNSLPIINWKATVRVWAKNKSKWAEEKSNTKSQEQIEFEKKLAASRKGGY